MKIANVELYREGELLTNTHFEEVRGFENIAWTPSHVVFEMSDGTVVAYIATLVRVVKTMMEEDYVY